MERLSIPRTVNPKPTTAIDTAVRSFAVWADPVLSDNQRRAEGHGQRHQLPLSPSPGCCWCCWRGAGRAGRPGAGCAAEHPLRRSVFSLIGAVGYWDMMLVTLSIVIASVIISLIIGLPVGILLSGSDRANRVVRPILDTMQTMPVFVYLIPALLLFDTETPRGDRHGDLRRGAGDPADQPGHPAGGQEVVEAAMAFGSTKRQALFKVQIPRPCPPL